ncbi:MAG: ABC transporter ATP-binding protein [Actinobacteria bacterium]|nr:ABC transporter ATP-binding protein [Actinomycetota bacterium]
MPEQDDRPILALEQLSVDVATPSGPVRLVDRLDLALHRGERVALVGESGCGKSVTARAVLRLDRNVGLSGRVLLGDRDILQMSTRELRAVRGARIGMVFQDPMTGLNPLMTVGDQVAETLRVRGVSRREANRRAVEALERLRIADAARRLDAYPHEFSGGMRQRVCLAMAIVAGPEVLLADEPTTALDVRVQEQVLTLIDELSRESGLAVLLITHDLGIVAGFADRVAVLYSGRKVEDGDVDRTYADPLHPYTTGLLDAIPRIDQPRQDRLISIPGTLPAPADRPEGCAFHPRCPSRLPICGLEAPPLVGIGPDGRHVSCHLHVAAVEEER